MSLLPLKITDFTLDCKIQNMKQTVEKIFDTLILKYEPCQEIRDLKLLSFSLYSECMLAYDKEKVKNKELRNQFDQLQQEAALEFSLRQNDFIKTFELFEKEINKLRQENRSLVDQIDQQLSSCQNFQKNLNFLIDESLTTGLPGNKEQGFEYRFREIKELTRKYFNQSPSLVSSTQPASGRPPRSNRHKSQDFQLSQAPKSQNFTPESQPVRDSVSSLNRFLEETYKNSFINQKSFKENIPVIPMSSLKLDTFRTISSIQTPVHDSFITVESPSENPLSIFPTLENSVISYKN